MLDLPPQRSDSPPAPRAGRFEILGAWLHIWTPPRGVVVPPVPWRRVALGTVIVALGLGGLGLWLVPRIERSKRTQTRAAQRQAGLLVASERTRLLAEQRLHRARATGLPSPATPAGRRRRAGALVADLEASITADARARVRVGSLDGPIAHTRCQPYPTPVAGSPRPSSPGAAATTTPAAKYQCLAVTGAIRAGTGRVAGSVGYPFWARLDVLAGSYLWCKINPRPGEQAIGLQAASVPLPRPCDLEAG
jgi:hypothetical protein